MLLASHWEEKKYYLAQRFDKLNQQETVIIYKSGAESATLLRGRNYEWVSYNGHPSIYVTTDSVVNAAEITSGLIAALNAPRLERVLVLGFGTGITAGTAACYFDHTDVVELNNAFYQMIPELRHANMGIEFNSSADLNLCDARTFLYNRHHEYDVIVNSIPAPTYFSASKIYTLQFFSRISDVLKSDGIYCTWLSPYDMSEQGMQLLLSTIQSQFSVCQLYLLRGNYYMAVCSKKPVVPCAFHDLPACPAVESALKKGWSRLQLNDYCEDICLSENIFLFKEFDNPQQNTDDFPRLEFMLARHYQTGELGEDPFITDMDNYHIDLLRGLDTASAARKVERALTMKRLQSKLLDRVMIPYLKNDVAAWKIWKNPRLKQENPQL